MPIPVALLDANVLYPAPLRDFLLQLAYADFFEPKWSEEIQDEWTRNLLANRSDLTAAKLTDTRDAMARAFPRAGVAGYEPRIEMLTNHPKDRHVLAAAIEGQAGFLVTSSSDDVVATVRRHRSLLTRPPKSTVEYLNSLEHCGLVQTAGWLQKYFESL